MGLSSKLKDIAAENQIKEIEELLSPSFTIPAQNKKLLTSINVTNTLEHIKFLPRGEAALLASLIRKSRLRNSEHDIEAANFDFANGYLAHLMRYCREAARGCKEGLQARGIILVDGKPWADKKSKPQRTQVITFTPAFVEWFKKCVAEKRIQDSRLFGYCDGYLAKMEQKRVRAIVAKIAFNSRQVLITAVDNLSCLGKELVPPRTNSVGIISKIRDLNIEYMLGEGKTYFGKKESVKSKISHALLSTLIQTKTEKYKPLTKATIKFCSDLLDSGMTKFEVARQMISQGYVKTVEEFEAKVFSQTIVQGS